MCPIFGGICLGWMLGSACTFFLYTRHQNGRSPSLPTFREQGTRDSQHRHSPHRVFHRVMKYLGGQPCTTAHVHTSVVFACPSLRLEVEVYSSVLASTVFPVLTSTGGADYGPGRGSQHPDQDDI